MGDLEIYADVGTEHLIERVRARARESGFREGTSVDTPYNVVLTAQPRTKVASLVGDAFAVSGACYPPNAFFAGDWSEPGRFGVRDGGDLHEWIDGAERIQLEYGPSGHFGGCEWHDVIDGKSSLPAHVIEPLAKRRPDVFAEGLLDELYGPHGGPGSSLSFHRAFNRVGDQATAAWFADAIERAWTGGEAQVGGLLSLVRRDRTDLDTQRAHVSLTAKPTDALRAWGNGGELPQADIPPAVYACLVRAMPALLEGVDVVFGRSLAFTAVVLPGYEGRNPRTGQAIVVPAKRMLYVLFFPR